MKLPAANFAPHIAALSAFEAMMLWVSVETVSIIITKLKAVVYHFFTVAPTDCPANDPCPSKTVIIVSDMQMQKTGMTVFVQKS